MISIMNHETYNVHKILRIKGSSSQGEKKKIEKLTIEMLFPTVLGKTSRLKA